MRRALRLLGRAAAGFAIASLALVALYRFVRPPITPLMALQAVSGHGLDERWVPLSGVSPDLLRAVIAAEDARFFEHRGVDFEEARRAWRDRARHPERRLRGASTITMQCARNVFLWPGRSWVRKGFELWFTLLVEALWGKRRILEVYLNVAEWGDGIYGAEAASHRYFGVRAAALTRRQAALLAAALPNPRRRNPAEPPRHLRARAARIEARAAAVSLRPLGGQGR